VPHPIGPVLTRALAGALRAAQARGDATFRGSFDLGRSEEEVALDADGFRWRGRAYPWPEGLKDRTLYRCDGDGSDGDERAWAPVQAFGHALVKLVPTDWGAPTFEIDGIKMLPTAQVSPWEDAGRKVALVQPRGKVVLDTCGGLGYFAAWCLAGGAARVLSFEKNPDVLGLRRANPWSPDPEAAEAGGRLVLTHAPIDEAIRGLADASVDAALHDPPRFGIAGELYSQAFYDQLARVLRPGGRLFHYTGAPNRLTSGRDVPREVAKRLVAAGFAAELALDGVLAIKPQAGRGRPGSSTATPRRHPAAGRRSPPG
jgi:predicted methyltransferase